MWGAYAWSSSAPMPRTGNPLSALMRRLSCSPSAPKSMPWLLAIVTPSTPAARSASRAWAGTWKVNALGCGDPPEPSAASRLTKVRSAPDSTGAMAPRTPAGSACSAPTWSSKLESPAKASVTAWPDPSGPRAVVVVIVVVVSSAAGGPVGGRGAGGRVAGRRITRCHVSRGGAGTGRGQTGDHDRDHQDDRGCAHRRRLATVHGRASASRNCIGGDLGPRLRSPNRPDGSASRSGGVVGPPGRFRASAVPAIGPQRRGSPAQLQSTQFQSTAAGAVNVDCPTPPGPCAPDRVDPRTRRPAPPGASQQEHHVPQQLHRPSRPGRPVRPRVRARRLRRLLRRGHARSRPATTWSRRGSAPSATSTTVAPRAPRRTPATAPAS